MKPLLDGCTPWPQECVDHYWAAGHWRGNTLDNLLRGWALQYGPRTALVHGDTRVTYAKLNRRVDRVAAGFRLRGLGPGQRVVVQLPNVPEFVITAFALMRVGAVPVFCPLPYGAAEVAHLVQVTESVGYVGPSTHRGFDHMAMAADIAARGPFLRKVFTFEAPGTASPYGGFTTDPAGCYYFPLDSVDSPPEPTPPRGADQVAFLLLADAGAGTPQLVPRTHNDYVYQVRATAELVSLTENDVYLAALPASAHFAFGCPGIVGTFSVGGAVVLVDEPEDRDGQDGQDPAACLRAVERERVTLTSVEPELAHRWLDVLPGVRADLSSLRLVQIGAGRGHGTTVERLGSALGCAVQQVFAMAEGPLTLTRPGDPAETVLGTQGRPLSPDDQLRIVDADGEPLPDGERGELLARGPHVPRGHYRAPEHNARAFTPDGYLRTGRLAHRTPDGNLVVAGPVEEA
ncbi:AMP-binding protein [Streptomyces sp. NPDC058623]|uniref:AMP-binding protein n=1 Tax=Streptomyces sp. NPDC058623 TaxID=3346563 RepID=UPI003666DF82